MVQNDDIDTQAVTVIGLVGAIITFALIVAVQVLYYRMTREDEERKNTHRPRPVTTLLAEQRASLARYHWIDKDKGVVAIPIERAMELTVKARTAPSKPPNP